MPLLEAPSWTMDVERGPDWLFLRLHSPKKESRDCRGVAEQVWEVMQQHFARRVVLELQEVKALNSRLIGQLVLLQKRICAGGGTMRICGLSDANRDALQIVRLNERLPCYCNREDAVMGYRPKQPR